MMTWARILIKFPKGNEGARDEGTNKTEQIPKTQSSMDDGAPTMRTRTTMGMSMKRNWEDIEKDTVEGAEEVERQQEAEYTHRHPMA